MYEKLRNELLACPEITFTPSQEQRQRQEERRQRQEEQRQYHGAEYMSATLQTEYQIKQIQM